MRQTYRRFVLLAVLAAAFLLTGVGTTKAQAASRVVDEAQLTAVGAVQPWTSDSWRAGNIHLQMFVGKRELAQEMFGGCKAIYRGSGVVARIRLTNCGHPGPSVVKMRYVSMGAPKEFVVRLTI